MSRRPFPRRAALAAAAAALAVVAVACSSTSEQVRDQIAEQAQKSLALDAPPTVTCPDGAEAGKGKSFECTIEIEGDSLTTKVVFTDDSHFDSNVQGAVYDRKKLEGNLTDQITAQNVEVTSLACPGKTFIVLSPDETVECPAEAADGSKATIVVGLDDQFNATIVDVRAA